MIGQLKRRPSLSTLLDVSSQPALVQTGDKKLVTETSPHKQPRHRAVVRFISAEIAARAVRELHGQYLLNTPVAMRLIH